MMKLLSIVDPVAVIQMTKLMDRELETKDRLVVFSRMVCDTTPIGMVIPLSSKL